MTAVVRRTGPCRAGRARRPRHRGVRDGRRSSSPPGLRVLPPAGLLACGRPSAPVRLRGPLRGSPPRAPARRSRAAPTAASPAAVAPRTRAPQPTCKAKRPQQTGPPRCSAPASPRVRARLPVPQDASPARAASTARRQRPRARRKATTRPTRGPRVRARPAEPQAGSRACAASTAKTAPLGARARAPRAVPPNRERSTGRAPRPAGMPGRRVALDRAVTNPGTRRPRVAARARIQDRRVASQRCGASTRRVLGAWRAGGPPACGRWRRGASMAVRRRLAAVREVCPAGKAIRLRAAGPRAAAAGAGRGSSRRAPPGGTCSFPRRGRRRGGVRAGRCLRDRGLDGRVGRISR
jgi:hypothetical protein